MSKRILFVDDEESVLRGLRRTMLEMEDEWEMEFASSGETALQVLKNQDFDVIVSDMRMPEMDGSELLQKVAEGYPDIVRIVLSGHSDMELIMKAVGPTHQYLSKPCSAESLNEVLEQAFSIRGLLSNDRLKSLVSRLKDIPSMPMLYKKVILEMQSPDFRLARIGEIISRDAGMTTKVLQMVNSSFFGLGVKVSDPAHAAKLLGADILKSLILSIKIFSEFKGTQKQQKYIECLSNHSLQVALLAKKIAAHENADKSEMSDAFVAGITHDIGKMILIQNLPVEYEACLTRAQEQSTTELAAEYEILGSSHMEVGAYLTGLWGLPANIVNAVAYHHRPSKCSETQFSPLTAIHIANSLIIKQPLDEPYLEGLGLLQHLPEWEKIFTDA